MEFGPSKILLQRLGVDPHLRGSHWDAMELNAGSGIGRHRQDCGFHGKLAGHPLRPDQSECGRETTPDGSVKPCPPARTVKPLRSACLALSRARAALVSG